MKVQVDASQYIVLHPPTPIFTMSMPASPHPTFLHQCLRLHIMPPFSKCTFPLVSWKPELCPKHFLHAKRATTLAALSEKSPSKRKASLYLITDLNSYIVPSPSYGFIPGFIVLSVFTYMITFSSLPDSS